MAFLSDLDRKISMLGQGAIQKTQDVTDTAKMAATIRGLDAQKREAFEQLGQFYYDNYEKYGGELPETAAGLVNKIENLEAQKKQLQEQMQKIKGTIFCPNCNTEIPANSQFCNVCGTKIEQPQPEPPVQPSGRVCAKCGAPLEEDQLFCTNCGAKVEAAPAPAPTPAPTPAPVPTPSPVPAVEEPPVSEPEKILCPNCGKELKPEQKFCTSCGTQIRP